MPNWCETSVVFKGPKNEIENLQELVLQWTSKEYQKSDFGKQWLGNIVLGAGFKTSENGGFRCRGMMIYMDEDPAEEIAPGVYRWDVTYQSAWSPVHEMWEAIIKKYAPSCQMYWYAEEPGCADYVTNDVKKEFFIDDYVVSCYFESDIRLSELFEDGEIAYTADALKKLLAKVTGEKALDEMIHDVNQMPMKGDDFIQIYPIIRIAG